MLNLVRRSVCTGVSRATEGDLSRLRARHVSEEPLAEHRAGLELGELLLGSASSRPAVSSPSILADAFEALFGALYLDGGLETARLFVGRLLESRIAAPPEPAT